MNPYEAAMRRALALSRRGTGFVAPNPLVGAVVLKGGRVLGEGFHARHGGDHAEVQALKRAGKTARGAVLVVTLEPCGHFGKTPPCTQAILEAGIRRLIFGAADTTGNGGGRLLRARGIKVTGGVLRDECRRINGAFFKHHSTGLPLVTAKWAMTLDGKLAARNGTSRWITSEKARRLGHRLRGAVDAVLIGIGTAIADNPRLTCRTGRFPNPRRVVLDPGARLPLDSRLVKTISEAELILLTSKKAPLTRIERLKKRGCKVLVVPGNPEQLNPRTCLKKLGKLGITSLLIEGGSKTLGAFFDSGSIDAVYVFIAPKLTGGENAPSPLGGLGFASMANAPALQQVETKRLGPDILMNGVLGKWNWQ